MKDTVIYSFFLPTHVLFQNRPRLSEGSDTCIHFSCCFQQKHLSYNHGNRVLSHEVVYNERETIIKMIFLKKKVWSAYLIGFAGELAATKLTLDLALGAVVLQVVGQVAARQLDWAAIGAGYHIEGAGGEVALRDTKQVIRITPHAGCSSGGRRHVSEGMASYLQLLHLASPATALLAVDASDGQSQDLLLQLWVWVDLNRKARGGWCSRSQDVSPLVKCMWLWQVFATFVSFVITLRVGNMG